MFIRLLFLLLFTLFAVNTYALQSFHGRVTVLEPTYMPDTLVFHMDVGNQTCPAGVQ